MKKSVFCFLVLGIISLTNCNKDEPNNIIEEQYNITVEKPIEGQNFNLNDEVLIEGVVKGNFELHGYEIQLFNTSNNDSILYEKFIHTHGEEITISETWINNVSEHSDIRVEVSGLADHEGNDRKTKTINIHCHPM